MQRIKDFYYRPQNPHPSLGTPYKPNLKPRYGKCCLWPVEAGMKLVTRWNELLKII